MVRVCMTFLHMYSSLAFVLLALTPITIQATDTAWPAENDNCGQLLATAIVSAVETPMELLHIVNSSLKSLNTSKARNVYFAEEWLKPGLTNSMPMFRLLGHIPTSVIDVISNQTYSLDTDKTTVYFNHKIRGKLVAQLIVTVENPEALLNIFNQGPGLFVQTERSYWNTFGRIILHFKEGFFDTNDNDFKKVESAVSHLMDSYNVLIHGRNHRTDACELHHICFECCRDGKTCIKQMTKSVNLGEHLLNPFKTAFTGNANQRVIQTAAYNIFRTYYPSDRVDDKGRMIYQGSEVDILDIIANVMNFSYIYQEPEAPMNAGLILPNGSSTGLFGRVERKELDLAVSSLPMLYVRNLLVDYSFPYDYDGGHLLQKAPIIEPPGLMTLTAPFTFWAWIGTTVAFLAVTVTLYGTMVTSANFDGKMKKLTKRHGFKSEVLLYVLNSLTRQYTEKGFEEKVTVNGSRMIMSFWSLMAFILTTFYLSVQFNIFYEVTHTPIVDTGTDHMHMHKNIVVIPAAGTLSIQKGLGILDKTIVASPREMAEVYLPRLKDDDTILLGMYRNVLRNWMFNSPKVTTKLFNPNNFRMNKGFTLPYYIAVALQKRSPYTQKVSEICIRLEETGVVKYVYAHYIIKEGLYVASHEEMSYNPAAKAKRERPPMIPLTFRGHIGGSFYILLGGYGLALVVFLIERWA